MSIEHYFNELKKIYESIISFIDDESGEETNYQNLIKLFDDLKIRENKYELKSILHLLLNISNNHHRNSSFFDKIGQIFTYFKDQIKQTLTNYMIFNIFQSNKRILLLLIELEIFTLDLAILDSLEIKKYVSLFYIHYFFPETKPFFNKESADRLTEEMPKVFVDDLDEFKEIRRNGENDSYICTLIRNDLVEDFITHVSQTNLPLAETTIPPSIYETNCFIAERNPTLIEYAAFHGSIQIFRYLQNCEVQLTPSIWLYAIHSNNAELIHLLIEFNVHPPNESYVKCLEESIKCHHNEITYYIKENLLSKTENEVISSSSLKYYNFGELQIDSINQDYFYELCMYDYFQFVEVLLKCRDVDINTKINRRVFFYQNIFFIEF
ncbi:hypothetical protein M9Y10_007390 [Tritrichomonas musculus]|uniref:DUF3447 domain-containing protein n=1 Tax=Tritrichomonas musculus TaxID=1915356 RepID=A0ABR2J170_9EUKA